MASLMPMAPLSRGAAAASIDRLIACAERELRLCRRIFPRRIAGGRVSIGICLREMREIEDMRDMLRDTASTSDGFIPDPNREQEDIR